MQPPPPPALICSNDHMPVSRGYMRAQYPLLMAPRTDTEIYASTSVPAWYGKLKCRHVKPNPPNNNPCEQVLCKPKKHKHKYKMTQTSAQ